MRCKTTEGFCVFFFKPETSETGLYADPGDEAPLITSTDHLLSQTRERRNSISDLKYLAVRQGYTRQHYRLSTVQKDYHGVHEEEFSDQRQITGLMLVVLDMDFNLPLGTSCGPSVCRNLHRSPQPSEVAMGCCYELTVQDVTVPFQE